jgi:transposase
MFVKKHKPSSFCKLCSSNSIIKNRWLMQSKSNNIGLNGQKIYVGIDSHLKSWKVTIMLEHSTHKTFSQDPCAKDLARYLRKNFPGCSYYSAYEASFCGFSIHWALEENGIHNIIVNPADVPTTDKERKQKEDKRDSRKIAKSLRNGELEGIYIPTKAHIDFRGLVRYRKTLVKEISRNKNRIKSFLYFHGINIPKELDSSSSHWSGKFTQWLRTIESSTDFAKIVLINTLDTTEYLRANLLKVNRELRKVYKDSVYSFKLKLLCSIPGIGLIAAVTLLSELEDINRFKNLDTLCSYVGLVPTTYSSGENDKVGNITPRANKPLRSIVIESAWTAIRHDPSLALCFNRLCKRMKKNEAIIRIAKKLLNRVRYVMKNETEYVYAVV